MQNRARCLSLVWSAFWAGCLVLSLIGAGPAAVAQSAEVVGVTEKVAVQLRPQWTAGQATRYEFWNRFDKETQVDFAGKTQNQTTVTEVTGEVSWAVVNVRPDGGADCTMTLDWMRVQTQVTASNGRSQETVADSRKPGTPETKPMVELLSAMTGVAMKVKVAPDGSIIEAKGRDEMVRKTESPDFLPSALDFVESASDLATLPFAPPASAATADEPASLTIGKTWNADFTWDHEMGKLDQRWDYTLDRVENIAGLPVAVVTGQAKFKLDPKLPDRPAGAARPGQAD